MGLRNLVIRREAVLLPDGQSFEVRGLSLFDIMSVLNAYGPQMSIVFGKLTAAKRQGPITGGMVKETIASLTQEFPDLLAAAVALAADDYSPEGIRIVKQLPLPAQVQAVETIFSLTFQGEGDVGKLAESLSRMLVAVSGALTDLTLPNGIGASGGN